MKIVFSLSLFVLLAAAFVLASNHYGFTQKLMLPAFGLIVLGIVLYLMELVNE